METVTCSYCGTEYSRKMNACPRCGREETEVTEKMSRGMAAKHSKRDDTADSRIPRWMWIVSCIVLAIAVLIGVVAFIIQMGFLDGTFSLEGPSAELPETEKAIAEVQPQEEDLPEEDSEACVDLTLNHEELVFEEAGKRSFLTAVTSPADCKDEIEYVSLDEEIVTVSATGMLTAVAPGETQVVVSCGEVTKTCKVICEFEPSEEEDEEAEQDEESEEEENQTEPDEEQETEPAAAPEVAPDDFTLFYPGEVAQLLLSNVPEGAAVTYSSSNPAVAEVSASGQVTARANGQATITIKIGDVTLTSIARCSFENSAETG